MENNKFISLVDSSVKPHVDYTNKPARQDNENALFSLGDSIKSNYELTNTQSVLDGNINPFIEAYLKMESKNG